MSTGRGTYLLEKLETPAGWSHPAPNEPWAHGHLQQQIQDFVEAVATDQPALSGGTLSRDEVEVIYAAYRGAEKGRRVTLRP